MKHQLNTVHLRRRFRKSYPSYDQHAIVQKEITRRLLQRLDYIKFSPKRILDLSLHTEFSRRELTKRYPKAAYIATGIDPIAFTMHKKSLFKKPRAVCLPLQQLPFQNDSVDFIFMSLSLLWVEDAPQLLRECYRVLQTGGMLLFTSLGPDTLKELRVAAQAIGAASCVHEFIDMHNIGDALVELGFDNPVMDLEYLEMQYPSFSALVTDLKQSGVSSLVSQRRQGLMTSRYIEALKNHYPCFADQRVAATFEFVYGHAWVGQHKRQHVDKATGDVSVPVSILK